MSRKSCHVHWFSPGKTEWQALASWKLGFSCDSVWPGHALTCDDLRSVWSRSNLHASQNKFFTVWPPKPSQRKLKWKMIVCLTWFFFLRLACTCEDTCESVWPPNASVYASSTCVHLRLLAGPFGQGLKDTSLNGNTASLCYSNSRLRSRNTRLSRWRSIWNKRHTLSSF